MKINVRIVIALLLALMLSMFATAQPAEDGYLRFPITSEPTLLNPLLNDLIANSQITNQIFEGLVRFDPRTQEYTGAIADEWEVSEDGLTYTFHLRDGVLFHESEGVTYESREVSAEDIVWNYEMALNPDTEISIHAEGMTSIKGAAAFTAGETDTVEGVQALDEDTVQITLEVPDRLFLINGILAIISPEAYEQLGAAQFNSQPVGTGAFQFVEWLPEDHLTLAANPDYYVEGVPGIPGIHFMNYADSNTAALAYRANEVDFLFAFPTGQLTALKGEFAEEYNELPGLHVRYFGFDMVDGYLADKPLVRQAFNYALDRETAWDIVAEGARFPATLGMLVPSMPASTPSTLYEFNLERAAELLTEAGFPNGEGLEPIDLWVLSSIATEPHIVVWQDALTQLGVEVVITVEESGTYFDSIEDNPAVDMFVNGWAAGIPDPADVFNYLILDGQGSTGYDNDAVDELLNQGLVELDPAAREAIYQEAHDLIMADSPIVASAYSKVTWLAKPWVQGFAPAGGGVHTAPLKEVTLVNE
jgi:ABC-type transport system substrate-binding protein